MLPNTTPITVPCMVMTLGVYTRANKYTRGRRIGTKVNQTVYSLQFTINQRGQYMLNISDEITEQFGTLRDCYDGEALNSLLLLAILRELKLLNKKS